MTKQDKKIVKILKQFAANIEAGYIHGEQVAEPLDAFLDELLGDDAFGTEGQSDPRGNKRD